MTFGVCHNLCIISTKLSKADCINLFEIPILNGSFRTSKSTSFSRVYKGIKKNKDDPTYKIVNLTVQ